MAKEPKATELNDDELDQVAGGLSMEKKGKADIDNAVAGASITAKGPRVTVAGTSITAKGPRVK